MIAQTLEQHDVSDTELLQRHMAGEKKAFPVLIKRYESQLYGFLARYTGDRTLAEDVFQDTFLQVHQSAGTFDTDRNFRPWLFTVAANKARDAMRKRRRNSTVPLDAAVNTNGNRQTSFANLLPSDIPSPDKFSMNLETSQAVKSIVDAMPENLRMVLTLSYFQELPQKDIAGILAVPLGTVKSRLYTAVRLFAEKWKAWASGHETQSRRQEDNT